MSRRAPSAAEPISLRALNRATLARQELLLRGGCKALEVIERLCGLQGQVGNAPFIGLWNRIAGFRFDDLAALLTERRAVRATMMRGTVHVVSARDYLALRQLLQPAIARLFMANYGRKLRPGEIPEVLAAGEDILAREAVQGAEVNARLGALWPERDAVAMGMLARYLLPTIHVPPAGLWDRGAPPRLTMAATWLGQAPDASTEPDALVRRYLGGFGPASVADAQAWSGLTGLAAVFERLRPELMSFTGDDGRELFDLPEAPRPGEDVDVPRVRILPDYDNVLFGYADRRRLIADEHRASISMPNGYKPVVLVDSMAAGIWRFRKEKAARTIEIESFATIDRATRKAIEDEAHALLGFAWPELRHAVEVRQIGS